MANDLELLTDAQMQQFIREGYLLIQADFARPVHQEIYEQLERMLEQEKNPGNNLLPRVPQIQQVYNHPTVCGALTSLLGPNYLMNPHRYGHLNLPGSPGQHWHKDNYVFDEIIRHPRPRWVFAFYYPQDVTADMGPTGILPGKHYYHHISSDDPAQTTETELPLCGPAGTVALVHYDSWHRATANSSAKKRYMLKFLFERMAEPRQPAWNNASPAWQCDDSDPHAAVNADVWRWLRGDTASPAETPEARDAAPKLLAALEDEAEAVRLNAAYALAALGAPVVPTLIEALRAEAVAMADQIAAKMPGNPRGSNPAACPAGNALAAIGLPAVRPLIGLLQDDHWCVRTMAADTLGNIGLPAQEAVPALIQCLDDGHPRVRRHAAEALGRMEQGAAEAIPALIAHIRDNDVHVRHNAVLALAKIGLLANEAIPPLLETLEDEDRYVRYFAAVALRRIGTPEAREALLDALFTARWCPLTTGETPY
ncbi:MAG TPA: HEAT repeat domain-containing protein [Chthonomonadaceae bacterium]|nr:HEAT repeat domain-containing protein [Chthonomonadaceae bacterium]